MSSRTAPDDDVDDVMSSSALDVVNKHKSLSSSSSSAVDVVGTSSVVEKVEKEKQHRTWTKTNIASPSSLCPYCNVVFRHLDLSQNSVHQK